MPKLQPREEAHSRVRGRGKTRRVTNQRMRDVWGPAQSQPAAEMEGAANTVRPRHSHT